MTKRISGAEHPIAKIFSSDFEYVIPSYQRPYAWTADQVLELFDDLYDFYSQEEDDYFLGSIVLVKQESEPPAEVIDGQQRLTTLTILLAAITSKMTGKNKDTLHGYIKEPGNPFEGLEPKMRLTLRERDRTFFAEYVQDLKFESLLHMDQETLDNEAQRNIRANSRLLLGRLDHHFGENAAGLEGFARFLLRRCFLVAVSTPSQQSAFRVFSVLNSRGLDLQPTDIIKADTIGQLPSQEEQDAYNERWEDMEVELGRAGFNDLFAYTRMIFAKDKAKRALLEEFRAHVLSKVSSPIKLIEEVLEPYASALAMIRQSSYVASANAQDVNGYLKWLNRIDNSDWIPPAMLFLAKRKHEPDDVLRFFQKLERLAAYMHVCAKNVNERIERYGLLIAEIQGSHQGGEPVGSVELTTHEMAAMRVALNGNIYELTARRRNYIILRLDSFLSDGGASYDPTVLTIEHVLPQTVHAESGWARLWPTEEGRELWVHRIANLVPLNSRRNSQAQNYEFDRKKVAYFGGRSNVSSYVLTTQVLNTPMWTPEAVSDRQEDLLAVMAESWELGDPEGRRQDEDILSIFMT